MKIKHLFIAVLACAAFAACQKETPIEKSEVETGMSETNYISVKIANVPTTRADETFEDGLSNENKVNNVRLYFFDKDGNQANVIKTQGGFQNYFDYSGTAASLDPEEGNVEATVAAVIAVSTERGDLLPAQVAAVINCKPDEVTTLESLREKVANYYQIEDGENGNFIMSSSVYADGGRKDAVKLENKNFFRSEEEAKAAPVKIYVERVLAKVRVSIAESLTGTNGMYDLNTTSDKDAVAKDESNKVYVKFLGWLPTATADKSYLVKNINDSWNTTAPFEFWNNPIYYRSYWAMNPNGLSLQYYTYNEIKSNGLDKVYYCQENAPTVNDGAAKRTKVIIAAQLVNKEGEPFEIVEWQGFRYTEETVKIAVLAAIQGNYTSSSLVADDIEFKTPIDLGRPYGHQVYAHVKTTTANKVMQGDEEVDPTTINSWLESRGNIKFWNDGMTYYYTDIQHLAGSGEGQYGVVRNHIYDVKITGVTGLGTPVYDPSENPTETNPEEEIIPEKPKFDESYLAAQINILSWRIVNQNVSLGK